MSLLTSAATRFVILALLCCLAFPLHASLPPVGTRIVNQASARFHNSLGVFERLYSPEVVVRLQLLEAVRLTSDHSLSFPPGAPFAIAHRLENPGATTTAYRLNFVGEADSRFVVNQLALVHDANGNGTADAGEPRLNPGDFVTLAPGEAMNLVLTGLIPTLATNGAVARVALTATSREQGAQAVNTDTLAVSSGAASIKFFKSASAAEAKPNDEVIFTITGSNTGNSSAHGVSVTVDSAPVTLVLIRDNIPRNTIFAGIVSAAPGRALFHYWGEAADMLHSYPPTDATMLDAVVFALSELPPQHSFSVAFKVKVNANASGNFANTASAHFITGDTVREEVSNTTVVSVPVATAWVGNHANGEFAQLAPATSLGQGLFIRASAAACNERPGEIERHRIIITSTLTGDREEFWAEETGPNTGVFQILPAVETRDATAEAAQSGDRAMQTGANDRLLVEMECGGRNIVASVLIDPFGVVFNSQNNEPVAGAVVTLMDVTGGSNGGQPNKPATVFQADGVTVAPSTVTTRADGRFDFPLVPAGTYRLEVAPPAGLKFPSTIAADALPASRTIHVNGSFGGNFPVDATTGTVNLDVPVDLAPVGSGLFIEKTASRRSAELGDLVVFSIKVRNLTSTLLSGLRVLDDLPAGFRYQPGSARLDQLALTDPQGGVGPHLEFDLGTIGPLMTVTLTYQVRVGVGAQQGDGVNRARAVTSGPEGESNLAACKVLIEAGVFTDKGVVLGKVFVDANTNRVQNAGEPGVPGVRLYLEDGTFVITDSEGKFSLYGIRPRAHVLKLDTYTLPRGAQLVTTSTRNADDPGSLFVDLKRGELHRANFAVVATPEVLEAVKVRRAKAGALNAEIGRMVKEQLKPEGERPLLGDAKAQPAAGVIGVNALDATEPRSNTLRAESETGAPNFASLLPPDTLNGDNSRLPSLPVAALPHANLENSLTNITDNAPGFLDLKDGDTLPMAQANIRVKGLLGAVFVLRVNGREVPASRIGKRATLEERRLQAWEFIGVGFKPGTNSLELIQQDSFGNARGSQTITVRAPDKLGRIKIVLPKSDQSADGVTPARITVLLTDADGVPVTSRTPLTLEASTGRWEADDLDAREPGTQVFIEGGRAEFQLRAPAEPGTSEIIVSSGALKDRGELPFLPELRPFLAAGIIEGTLRLNSLSAGSLVPARSQDGFEEELNSFAVSGNDDKTRAAGRAAFFLKGKIKGEYLLTAAYDSDKDSRERLFRDIQPDEFYPVYGDSSVRGFDAQSTGRLYVRVDKRKSYLLYGDFNTQQQSNEGRGLANYSRSLTGIKEHYENDRVRANLWASEDSTRQVVEELPGNGTSGPYQFQTASGIVNSEKVEVLTRDPNHPDIILKIVPMTRFTDYEFEPFTGQILFKSPVPSLDANLNPISIRVTYESDQGGDKFWVYGGDAQVKLHDRVEVGGSAVRDENPQNHYQLYSANTTLKLAPQTFLFGEVARSESDLSAPGNGGRVELRHKSAGTELRAYHGQTDDTFTNTGSIQLPGRTESGLKLTQRLDANTRLVVQGLLTEEAEPGGTRRGIGVDVERSFPGNYRVEVGGRVSDESVRTAGPDGPLTADNEVRSVRMKVTAPVPKVPKASVFAEYENDVVQTERQTIAVGGDYQIHPKTRLYAKHEFVSDLSGPLELNTAAQHNTTVVGLDTEYMKDGQMFDEYRSRDALTGREAEAAIGLRNLWHVADGVRLNTSFERVTPVSGNGKNEATALAGAIEYTRNPDWKGTARLELRDGESSDSLLNTFGYARKLSRDWTFLGKTILYLVDNETGRDRRLGRFQNGLAWRQTDVDVWSGLAKYEYKYEDGAFSLGDAAQRRQVHILSLHANYHPTADWTFSAHYAGKLALEAAPQSATYHAHLLSGRAIYEINRRWDVGLNVSTLFSGKMDSVQFGIGPEIGFTLRRNLRIGVGYNFSGFRDRDLANQDNTGHGVFVNLRLKFDEGLFAFARKEKETK